MKIKKIGLIENIPYQSRFGGFASAARRQSSEGNTPSPQPATPVLVREPGDSAPQIRDR